MADLTPWISLCGLLVACIAAIYSIRSFRRLSRQDKSVTWKVEKVDGSSYVLRNAGPGTAYDVTVDLSAAMALTTYEQRGVEVAAGAAIELGSLAPRSNFTAWPKVRVQFRRANWRGRPGRLEQFTSAIT